MLGIFRYLCDRNEHDVNGARGGIEPPTRGVSVLQNPQANLARALRVDDLARRAAMSPRTFARQFVRQNGTTPHRWLLHQRVLAAQRRLEKTAESIDQVAAAVGLESAATLRVHFARALGVSPAAYRRRFSTTTTRPV